MAHQYSRVGFKLSVEVNEVNLSLSYGGVIAAQGPNCVIQTNTKTIQDISSKNKQRQTEEKTNNHTKGVGNARATKRASLVELSKPM